MGRYPSALSFMGAAALEMGLAAPTVPPEERERLFRKVSQAVIQMRCTDRLLASFGLVLGVCAIFLQTLSLCTDHWVQTQEPRPINMTDEFGFTKYTIFVYNSGYFRMCRERMVPKNENLTDHEWRYFYQSPEFRRICEFNRFFSEQDLSHLSRATAGIMVRIQLTSIIHTCGLIVTFVATLYGFSGYQHRNHRTIISGISYIIGGLMICISVMQYICVVDDELSPRMKPTAAGEPSKYGFSYGYSFLSGSLSFLVIQICALCHLFLYLRRFPSIEDKMSIIPGLEEKVRRVQLEKELGLEPPSPVHTKKGSLAGSHSPSGYHEHTPSHKEIEYFLMENV